MRRFMLATVTSLALALPVMIAAPVRAQTADDTAAATTTTTTTTTTHHRRRHHHHRRHHAMTSQAGTGADGATRRPDISGSAGTGTSPANTTGAQTSLPNAISNQAPNATH